MMSLAELDDAMDKLPLPLEIRENYVSTIIFAIAARPSSAYPENELVAINFAVQVIVRLAKKYLSDSPNPEERKQVARDLLRECHLIATGETPVRIDA